MRYRDARLLKQGDKVTSKESSVQYFVKNIEVYGNVKMIRINCVTEDGHGDTSFFHNEVE
jgi:hypothetical protein